MNEQRRGSHTVSRLSVYLVWTTKYRYHVLQGAQHSCLVFLIILCSLSCLAQTAEKNVVAVRQIILKKQILTDEFDERTKTVPFAAVRIFVRLKLAEWLWRKGRDDTGRAEQIAVKAVEDFYENENEIPDSHYLKTNLFNLLETNAKETWLKLRAKYKIEDDIGSWLPLLNKEGGDKVVAGKIGKYLIGAKDLGAVALYLDIMRKRKSPEFTPLLFEIISLEESGGNNFTAESFFWIADDFRDSAVPNDLRIRFYKIVLNKSRNALQSSDTDEIYFADLLLYAVLPDIAANAPELAGEANAIKSALAMKTSQRTKKSEETNQRIKESASKLDTLISEADKTNDKGEKYSLLDRASQLAMQEGKCRLAVDLIEKTIDDKSEKDFPALEFRLGYHDQQLGQITDAALKNNDIDSAAYATKKIINQLKKADVLIRTASYFHEKKDSAAALDAYDEALKLTAKADNDKLKFYTLFRLINAAAAIDSSRISEVNSITATAIDKFPTLDSEDKPATEKFKNYVTTIMAVNYNLFFVISRLAKNNKNEATDFANQINRREVRITADLILATEALEAETKIAGLK